jgi:hypothetical protein
MESVTLSMIKSSLEHLYVRKRADYMVYLVEGATPMPEVTIQHRDNFESKVAYMEKAYNEDLTLKNNPNIKITQVDFIPERLLAETINGYMRG